MANINIVLWEPEIPQNTGNIARTCACTGAALHLIEPLGFKIDDAKLKRAGLDYWHSLDITYYKNADEFFEKNPDANFFCFSTKAPRSYSEVEYPMPCYLIFGKETKGIPEDFLAANYEKCVRLPMKPNQRSLNLANTVAIATYEVLRQHGFPDLKAIGHIPK